MKNILIKFLLFTASLIMGCAGTPERTDGGPYQESQYKADDRACNTKVKNDNPILFQSKGIEKMQNTDALPILVLDYKRCMKEKGWKNF